MSGMNEFLAAYYGTGGTTSSQGVSEDVEKQAQIQLFAKIASEQQIDLTQLSDQQVAGLWNNFQKVAEEGKEEDKDKKVEKAKEEHEEKKAAAEKIAEADFLGRVMAHSYVDELKKIASTNGDDVDVDAIKAAASGFSKIREGAKEVGSRGKELLMGSKAKSLKHNAEQARGIAGRASPGSSLHSAAKGKAEKSFAAHSEEAKKVRNARIGAGAGAAGAAAAGGAAAAFGRKKESSALDELAAEAAVVKAAEANFDLDEASERVAAVLTLGAPEENSKVASASDLAGAIDIRALELLELAGYPVTWDA